MKLAFILCSSLWFSMIAFSQETVTDANVEFKIRNFGINVDGQFNRSSITTNFASSNSSQWILKGYVDVNSIDTENKKRDTHLKSEDYFDSDTYPKIVLEATNFKKISQIKYDVTVDLTIKNVTKSMTIPVKIIHTENKVNVETKFEIDRLDFEVGDSSLVMSNTVKINVAYSFNKK